MKKVLKEIVVYSDGRFEFRECPDSCPFSEFMWYSNYGAVGFQGYTLKECKTRALKYYHKEIDEEIEKLATLHKNLEFIQTNLDSLKMIENQK